MCSPSGGPSSISPSSGGARLRFRSRTVESITLVKAKLQNSRHQMQFKKFTRQLLNSKIISHYANLYGCRLPKDLASWRLQITEAWGHVDGTRVRKVMGPQSRGSIDSGAKIPPKLGDLPQSKTEASSKPVSRIQHKGAWKNAIIVKIVCAPPYTLQEPSHK